MNETADHSHIFTDLIARLREGVEETAIALQAKDETHGVAAELNKALPLIRQLEEWSATLPESRMRESVLAVMVSLDAILRRAYQRQLLQPEAIGATGETPTPPFLIEALEECGPETTVSRDRLSARIVVQKDHAHLWTIETLKAGLNKQGIVFGIKDEGVKKALNNPGKPVAVAIGQAPVHGKDAEMEDCLNLAALDGRPTFTPSGQANFKRLNQYRNISQGQVILKKTPLTYGQPGMDVFGESIPARDGTDLLFPTVENTAISEDGLSMYATVDGCCYFEGDQLAVVPGLRIENNVDYSTGNVDVEVAVTVKGDVLSGFKVVSNADIAVEGTVEGAELSAQGHLFLEGGVQGKGEARLLANKHIHVKFINSARMATHGDVRVDGSVMHSSIRCHRLFSLGENAEIIGGKIEVVDDLGADQLGTEMGVKTKIVLGHDIVALQQAIEESEDEMETLRDKQQRLTENQGKLLKAKQEMGSLTEEFEKKLTSIQNALPKVEKKMQHLEEQLERHREAFEQAKYRKRMVRARKTIYPGVEIEIMGQSKTFQVPTGPASIAWVDEQIVVLPYEERQFVEEDDVE